MSETRTLCDCFFRGLQAGRGAEALRVERGGRWVGLSPDDVRRSVEELSLGLRKLGVGRGDRVALVSENRPEWLLVDYAVLTLGAVTVPIYPTLSPRDTGYIVQDSEAVAVVVSCPEQAQKVIPQLPQLTSVKSWLIMDPPRGGIQGFRDLAALREEGREVAEAEPGLHRRLASEVEPEDLASLVYTSGTTGKPKGVMLTHDNFVQNLQAALQVVDVGPGDRALSFLPLSHALQRMADFAFFREGVTIAYVAEMEKVPEALLEVRPTILVAVPRLFEKVYGKMLDSVASAFYPKKVLVHWAVATFREWALRTLEAGGAGAGLAFGRAVADLLVGSKLRAKLGGKLRFVVSGGAPLARELGLFFYGAGIPITEGYGLTESSPIISVNPPARPKYGSIGVPVPGVEVKIAEDGEIMARGRNVMKGYYRLPEATAEALTSDGWLRTGDIGTADGDGYLYITDRKKELLVTAAGKKVAPQPIENMLKLNKYVSQAILIGDERPFITALIVPNWENVLAYARRKGVAEQGRAELCDHPQVRHLFGNVLERANRQLSRFEQIKRCAVLPSDFSLEEGELTPTMKLKRGAILRRYAGIVESMYDAGEDR